MIDGRLLEHEYDPAGGCFGRAFSTSQSPANWGANLPVAERPITGITPEQVDLSLYQRVVIGSQDTFPMYGADGGLATMRMRIWKREESGRHYCIVFEEFV